MTKGARKELVYLLENDEISPQEAAFMIGYFNE